jgi:DNA polymerase-3 subunit alpha
LSTSYLETHPDSFVHLHLHTQYSLLDGAIRIKDLVSQAGLEKMPAVAASDHGNMFGAIDFYESCKKGGVKPILGSEIYFTPGSRFDRKPLRKSEVVSSQDAEESRHHIHHLVLLCKNNVGYQNLCKLLSQAYLEGFYYKPRVDLELLKKYREGLIATTACLKGEVAYNFFIGKDDRAGEAVFKLQEVFGEDLYLEIQENGLEEQKSVNEKLIEFAQKNNIKLVATNDCHYMTPEDAKAQEVLLCIQTGKTLSDERRMKLTSNEFYFKSAKQMREAFYYIPEACDNTLRIADQCNVDLRWIDENGRQIYHLPDFEIPTSESLEDYFRRVSMEGLEQRFKGPHFKNKIHCDEWSKHLKKQYEDRLEEEINLIIKTGFAGYFLIVFDFIRFAKSQKIPVGPGRGSGAGSLVAYALEITNVDPIPFNLLFERFINPERVSLPDFDVDFCQTGRQKVIDYVTQKYGVDKVGQIITFGKLQAKAVLRDVSRVYDLPYSEADMLAKLVPDELGITLEDALRLEPKLQSLVDKDPKIRQIVNISKRLEGLLRHASIHAAGVIITNRPLVEYCPLFRGKEGEQVVQFDKDFSEKIGLVKFDFLGLKTLTVIDTAQNFIRRDHDQAFDLEAVSMDDPKIFEFISQGHTIGVFQLESSGMIDLCKRIKPDSMEDITAINALYRPGPLESGMVDDFIEIKHGRKKMSFPFLQLESVLKDTYGVIVYQEQVMKTAQVIAGYTLGQADMLRRAMGKKKADVMDENRKTFVDGASKNGFDTKKAEELFDLMAKFAAYGFNKSHAVAYAFIAYHTAYLKYYYPTSFYAALLTTEMSNTDKVTVYIRDACHFNVAVLPVDINESLWIFNVVGKNIRFGMGAIKNVGENAVEAIVLERETNGPFQGILDFIERVSLKALNKRVVESLIKVGAFDSCEPMNRKTMLENLELILTYGHKVQSERETGQGNLFDMGLENENAPHDLRKMLSLQEIPDFEDKEKLGHEKELLGIYVSGHPLDKFENVMKQLTSMQIVAVKDIPKGRAIQDQKYGGERYEREVTLAGMITDFKSLLTKKGERMAFATLEDLTGKIECIIFPKVFEQYAELLTSDEPLVFTGRVNLAEEPRKLFPQKIQLLKDETEEKVVGVRIKIPLEKAKELDLQKLRTVLLSYRGSTPLHIIFESTQGKARMNLGEDFLVSPTPQLAAKVNDIFQTNSVYFLVDGKVIDASLEDTHLNA